MTSATDRGKGHGGSNGHSSNHSGGQQHHHQQHHHHSNSNGHSNGNHNNNNNGHHHHRHHNKDHHHHASSSSTAAAAAAAAAQATTPATTTTTTSLWPDAKSPTISSQPSSAGHRQCSRHAPATHSRSKAESVLSTDSDIRFTRRKLGDSQRCGCAVIAGFLLTLLLASLAIYVGYTYLRPDPLPERVFRAKLRITDGDAWSPELADQNSMRFQHKQRDYRERINLVVRRSELRDAYEGSEVLALDGSDGQPDLTVHVNLHFDPYRTPFTAADLTAIFLAEINAPLARRRHFGNLTVDPHSLHIAEVRGDQSDNLDDPNGGSAGSSASAIGSRTAVPVTSPAPATPVTPPAPRFCQPLRLPYCASIGYNSTVYPNHLGHADIAAVNADLIAFRELVDAECFRQAFDFVCRLLQPPCIEHVAGQPHAQPLCRAYCQQFWQGCGGRLPERFRRYLDCERFPEAEGAQSCQGRPGCAAELRGDALSGRLCDGVADCPDLTDETQCAYCAPGALYCGRGRACIAQQARCDGRVDCPDGSDERDCLSIAPQVSLLTMPPALTPHRPRFFADGFAVFLEKGETGKLCAEGLDGPRDQTLRRTVAESLCKSLGYEKLDFTEVRNDTEPRQHYVRVLDPRAEEISFVRTACAKRQALYVACADLECGISSSNANTLPKMAAAGDWPWHVSLFRDDTHVCDGTLISADWVLTTESCFQGQAKATWMAVFGAIRRLSQAPWTQRRRIIGMVKSPVEGSTAALIRLETPVAFSNFIRPICLSDQHHQQHQQQITSGATITPLGGASTAADRPHTERLTKEHDDTSSSVDQHYFVIPQSAAGASEYTAGYADDLEQNPHAAALGQLSQPYQQQQQPQPFRPSAPLLAPTNHRGGANRQLSDSVYTQNHHREVHQTPFEAKQPAPPHIVQQYHDEQKQKKQQQQQQQLATSTVAPSPPSPPPAPQDHQQWTNCQTLGWSRQRDHLQRVQLQIGSMAACENVSIATVNSVCTAAVFHQQDCSEEEFAGSPMMCLLPPAPGTTTTMGATAAAAAPQQWALVGIASWRIVCAQMGIERPRMYDKIASNAAWIRDTISAG